MRKKTLHRVSAQILNSLLLFSILIPNLLSPVVVIAQDLDLAKTDSIAEIPTDESEDILEEGISTSIFEEGIYTVFPVEEKEYVYPEDDRVRITFTSVTEEGDLRISKVLLTDEEKELLNTTDSYAWDFTSTMANGSFTYDLVLPNDQGENIEVKYTEDGSTYNPIDSVLVEGNTIRISGLDHFTTFVVITPNPVGNGNNSDSESCVASGSGYTCYDTVQAAINAATNGDTILIRSNVDITSQITINKEITLEGNGFTIFSKFAKTDNSNNSAIGIQANNVTIRDLTIDGTDGTNLHGINIYTVNNILLDTVTSINNDRSGIVVNGSIVTARDITTSGNLWHGINVAQGSGVTSEARLIIEKISNQSDLFHIYIDDITTDSSVTDIDNQYNYADSENKRLYTLKPPVPSIPVLEYPIDGVSINDNTPLMQWEDSTVTGGSIKGYYYRIFYNCSDISNIPASCSVYPNSTGVWRPISEYQAGTTQDRTYYWQVKAVDMNDNESEWSELEKFTIDTIAPSAPIGLHRRGLDSTLYQCSDLTTLQTLIPDWDDNTESDLSHYEYTSFHPNGSIGINEQKLFTSEFVHSWVPTVDGTYGYAVRAVDLAGNKSAWSLSDKTLLGSCQITYDSTPPEAPSIVFPAEGQYFNSTPILNDWTDVSDTSGIKEYRIEYIYDDGHTFSGGPYRLTTLSQRNHVPNISEQGGVTIRVQAIDNVGNESAWSTPVHYFYDATKPSTPEVLGFNNPTTQCGGYTNVKNTTVDWSDSDGTGSPIKGYEYQINYPTTSGTRGLWTVFFNGVNSQYSGSLNEGRHYIRVRAQDMAGNWSNWSQDWLTPSTLTTDEMQDNCSIELDTIVPEIPTGLYFWDVDNNKEVMCGGYSNTKHIKEHWNSTSDINFYKYEYSSFNAPTGSAGLVSSPFYTNYFDSSWWNIPMEGTYGFQVRTVDLAGNISGWSLDGPYGFSSSCKIIIDWTPPSVEITNPSDTEYVKGTVDFRGSVQDSNLLRYYYSIEGVKSQTITTSTNLLDETIYTWDTTAKPDGEYEMRLEARDKANNKDNNISVDVINVIVDNTIPTVSTLDDFAILEGSTIPTKEVLAEDNFEIEKFCYSIQSDLGDHPNTCIFPSVETNSWNIDLTATILTELNNSYGINTLVADTSLIPEGDYTITYYSRDMAGNESNPHTFVVTIENVLPSLIFSSDSTVITEGNNVIFNGSFTDPGLDDSDWTYTLSFGDGTPDVTGSTPVIGQILSNVSHQYSAVGVFTAELEVCESSALCASEDIEITVDPIILPTETGEVAGATDTVKSPTIIKKVTTYVSDLFGIGSGDEDFEEEGEEVSSPEVKGSQTCENPSKISGYIYVDSNKNGEKDSDEKIYTDIPVRIYTKDDGTEETVKELTSDENGYWETTLCTGEYFVEIDESKLPDNFNIEENTLGVEIVENEDVTIDFAILDERNFLQKYWIWILVILGLVTVSGILLFGQNKKKTF